MDAAELAVAALTGSLGAVIAIVGSVSVLAVTWRKERRDAALRAQEAAAALAVRERAERVARVRAAVNGELLTSAMRWAGLGVNRGLAEVYRALSEVAIHEAEEHRAVSDWVLERLNALADRVQRAQRLWLMPGHGARFGSVMREATEISTALTYWHAGHLSDEWFAERVTPAAGPE